MRKHWLQRIEQSIASDIFLQRKRWYSPLLFLAASVFAAGAFIRRKLYEKRVFRLVKPTIPTISIGNIIAGGSGKTPFILKLLTDLQSNLHVGVLLRGYRKKKAFQIKRVKRCDPNCYGDEAALIHQKFPLCDVVVGKNRKLAMKALWGSDLALLDDGMQYLSLKKDVEVVMIHGEYPLGFNQFLPLGLLRDSPKQLQKADYLVVNHVRSDEHLARITAQLRHYSQAPIIAVANKICTPLPKKAIAFCGIGIPENFKKMLLKAGVTLEGFFPLVDHAEISQSFIEEVGKKAKEHQGAQILCTEKDWVKIPKKLQSQYPIRPVSIELEIIKGAKHYQSLLKKIKHLAHLNREEKKKAQQVFLFKREFAKGNSY